MTEDNLARIDNTRNNLFRFFYNYIDKRVFRIIPNIGKSAIRIVGKSQDNATDIYIRFEASANDVKVNFSNVSIDPKFQRKGMFTKLVKATIDSGLTSTIIIGGVCTESMRNWCIKNNFVKNPWIDFELNNDYVYIIGNSQGGS